MKLMKRVFFIVFIQSAIFSSKSLGAEEGMPQLNPEFWFSQTFWLILVFTILYLIIWKRILPKITDNLENRKKTISTDLEEAQNLKKLAEERYKEYKKLINDAKNESGKIISESKLKLDQDLNNKKMEMQKEIDREINEVEKEIKNFKKKSLESVSKISKEISSEVIKKILNTEVNESNLSAIVEEVSQKRLKNNLQ
jgi:F-type H+-transporting ATPase subunit b